MAFGVIRGKSGAARRRISYRDAVTVSVPFVWGAAWTVTLESLSTWEKYVEPWNMSKEQRLPRRDPGFNIWFKKEAWKPEIPTHLDQTQRIVKETMPVPEKATVLSFTVMLCKFADRSLGNEKLTGGLSALWASITQLPGTNAVLKGRLKHRRKLHAGCERCCLQRLASSQANSISSLIKIRLDVRILSRKVRQVARIHCSCREIRYLNSCDESFPFEEKQHSFLS